MGGAAQVSRASASCKAAVHAQAVSQTEDAWTLEWPGPILNPRAYALEQLEIPGACRHQQ